MVTMQFVPSSQYTDDDLCNTIRELGGLWDAVRRRADVEALHDRYRFSLGVTLARAGLPIPGAEADIAMRLREVWSPSIRSAAEEIVNDAIGLLHQAGRAVQLSDNRVATLYGTVEQLNTSQGGVPKRPIQQCVIGPRGVEGDRQAARVHHGRAWQAVCLWSAEVIERLRDEGHPIGFGSAGENVTIRGIAWEQVMVGTILRIGTCVVEISAAATPCKKNARWFKDGDFNRMNVQRDATVSRMYASVLVPGTARVCDPVVLEPVDL